MSAITIHVKIMAPVSIGIKDITVFVTVPGFLGRIVVNVSFKFIFV